MRLDSISDEHDRIQISCAGGVVCLTTPSPAGAEEFLPIASPSKEGVEEVFEKVAEIAMSALAPVKRRKSDCAVM